MVRVSRGTRLVSKTINNTTGIAGGTIAAQNADAVAITGGSIDGVNLGNNVNGMVSIAAGSERNVYSPNGFITGDQSGFGAYYIFRTGGLNRWNWLHNANAGQDHLSLQNYANDGATTDTIIRVYRTTGNTFFHKRSTFWQNVGLFPAGDFSAPNAKLHLNFGAVAGAIKLSNTATGTTATDGFDIGLSPTGAAEIRQLENLSIDVFTNNQARGGWAANGVFSTVGNTLINTAGVDRWRCLLAGAESGSNAGSNFQLSALSDANVSTTLIDINRLGVIGFTSASQIAVNGVFRCNTQAQIDGIRHPGFGTLVISSANDLFACRIVNSLPTGPLRQGLQIEAGSATTGQALQLTNLAGANAATFTVNTAGVSVDRELQSTVGFRAGVSGNRTISYTGGASKPISTGVASDTITLASCNAGDIALVTATDNSLPVQTVVVSTNGIVPFNSTGYNGKTAITHVTRYV